MQPARRTHPARSSHRWLVAMAALALLAATMPGRAVADPTLPVRKTGLARRGPNLVASVGLQDLFTPAERERLTSGFSTRVLIRVFLQQDGQPQPVAAAFQRAEIVYDIWDERFRVRITWGAGTDRVVEAKTADEAITAAATLREVAVAQQAQLKADGRYFLAVRGYLNPLSQELQAELRRWLRQPAGAQPRPGAGGGDAFFGSFVTVFVNPQIDDSEHQVRFVSQSFRGAGP